VRRYTAISLAATMVMLVVTPSFATNGMNMIGYGAVSSGMGGADLAVVDNASAMNINPAGICSCEGPQASIGTSALMPTIHHQDTVNDLDSKKQIFPLPLATYATPVEGTPLTFGLGLFAQGGMGVDYERQFFGPGGADQVYSNVGYMKVTPTLAWQSRDTRLKLGASLNIGQVTSDIEYLPNTVGFKANDLTAYGYGARLGFQYRIDDLVIGGAWLSKTKLNFKNGNLVLASDPSTRLETEMDGFDWPQQVGLGMAYNFGYAFRLAFDVDWVEWSQAVDTVKIDGLPYNFAMDWEDQWVFAVGAEWEFANGWLARLGYNHGDSPVPNATLSPLFPAIIEDHGTIGFGYRARSWQVDVAYEHGFEAEQTNPAPASGVTETHEQNTAHMMLTWYY